MDNPFRPQHFDRLDRSDDRGFYEFPRLVRHIDDAACVALASHFREVLPRSGVILDLMSSYASHLPADRAFRAVIGLGMNAPEMAANPQLTGGVVHDLNARPALPFHDECFDACLLTVSVQYLTEPVSVFADAARTLKPGAPFVVAYSNRMFPTKAVAIWRLSGDADHARLIALYFGLAGRYGRPAFRDLSPANGSGDPLYVVTAERLP